MNLRALIGDAVALLTLVIFSTVTLAFAAFLLAPQ